MPAPPDALAWALLGALGFLVGSIPFGLLIGRRMGIDIRAHGSGNIGATNVRRVLGKRAGTLCFALDVGKGLVPTLGAGLAMGVAGRLAIAPGEAWAWLAVMATPVLGHIFCPWIGFKGGKGVATGLGALVGVFPALAVPGAVALVAWLATLRVTRYVGVSSCVAAVLLPPSAWGWLTLGPGLVGGEPGARLPFVVVTALLAGLVILRHRGNLARTLAGTEPKVGGRAESARSGNGPSPA